jgi:hypothetical protein
MAAAVTISGELCIASFAPFSVFYRTREAVSTKAALECPQLGLSLTADPQLRKFVNDFGRHSSLPRPLTGIFVCNLTKSRWQSNPSRAEKFRTGGGV